MMEEEAKADKERTNALLTLGHGEQEDMEGSDHVRTCVYCSVGLAHKLVGARASSSPFLLALEI